MALYRYVPTVRYKFGLFCITVPCFVGWVLIRPKSDRGFKERNGYTPNVCIGFVSISWIKWGGSNG